MIMARTPAGWLIILQPDNLARMKQGDPVTIPDLGLTICYEAIPQEQLVKKLREGDPRKYLMRGYSEHPDDFTKPVPLGTSDSARK